MKKKLITLMLALVLCFAMCPAVHAANGDLAITAIVPGNMTVQFTTGSVQVMSDQGMHTAYYSYAQLPDNTNLSSVSTVFVYTGKALKINGTTVASYSTVSQRTYSHSEDFTSIATVEVVYGNNISRLYYVSAYNSEYYVKMSFEYENARTFSTLSGSTYGTSGMLDSVTSDQKTAAASAVVDMDTMCESMLPDVTAAEYKVLENILIEPNTMVPNSNTVFGLLEKFQTERTDFVFDVDDENYNLLSIGYLDKDSTGQQTYVEFGVTKVRGTGGWMYQVKRGGVTYTPLIGAEGWKLIPGDEIIWRYTCDYGYDIGAPMW